jgi:hypothetical protein
MLPARVQGGQDMKKDWRAALAEKEQAKKEKKGTKNKAQEMVEANQAKMASVNASAIPGACKYLGLINVGGTNYPTYADAHQGKHVSGYWENGPKQEDSCFLESMVKWNTTALLFQVAQNVPWGNVLNSTSGGDFHFKCSRVVGITDKGAEVDWIWVQGGFQDRFNIKHISFHAVPISEADIMPGWTRCADLTVT